MSVGAIKWCVPPPPPAPPSYRVLRAGPLETIFNPVDGSLRYLCAGGHEILRGIGAPIRDRAWATIEPRIEGLEIAQDAESFRVTFTARCTAPHVEFSWQGEIRGSASGRVEFRFEGEAQRDFERMRIGFCVLHQAELAGMPCRVMHTDGAVEFGRFPNGVRTDLPFAKIRSIRHLVAAGLEAEVSLEGDEFEMEDQRNWSDASFKTYCTPSALKRPVMLSRGTRITQRVVVELLGTVPVPPPNHQPPWAAPAEVLVNVGDAATAPFPPIGSLWNLTDFPAVLPAAIRPLGLKHLRVDLWLASAEWPARLESAARLAAELNVGLELAVFAGKDFASRLGALAARLTALRPPPRVDRWLVYHEEEAMAPLEAVAELRRQIQGIAGAAPIGAGPVDHYWELAQDPAAARAADFPALALNPQVHASDEMSLVETLAMQRLNAESAQSLGRGRAAAISLLTFTRRWRRHDAGAPPDRPANLLPFRPDPRLDSAFASAWLLGSLANLVRGSIRSVTCLEVAGPTGLFTATGEPRPLMQTLVAARDILETSPRKVETSHPLCVEGIAGRHGGDSRVLVCNLRGHPQSVRVRVADTEQIATLAPYAVQAFSFRSGES